MSQQFKAGVVQFDVQKGQIGRNMETIFALLEEMAGKGVSLAVLPEMFSSSFDNDFLADHAKKTPGILEQLAAFAREKQMAVAGSLPWAKEGGIYNTMVFIDRDGQLKGRYEKLHLFRLTGEHLYFGAGDKVVTVETSFGRIGLMICYDLRFPELCRALYLKGAKMIVTSAQWPVKRVSHWQTLVRARAIENQLFMVATDRTGTEDGLEFPGSSMIVDPWGETLVMTDDRDCAACAEIDLERVSAARKVIPCMTDRRRDIYG